MMQKHITLILIILILSLVTLHSQTVSDEIKNSGDLTVAVNSFENDKGQLKIALFNSKETYSNNLNESFISGHANIEGEKAIYVFDNIPFGEYAIKCYHDGNGNNKLDKNLLGIPKEKYGFSNNANGSFGIPDYKKVRFILNLEKKSIEIMLE